MEPSGLVSVPHPTLLGNLGEPVSMSTTTVEVSARCAHVAFPDCGSKNNAIRTLYRLGTILSSGLYNHHEV